MLTTIWLYPVGDHASDEDTLPFVVKYYTSEETKCTFQLSNEDDGEIYSLFLDVVSEIVDALTERDTKTFCKFLNPLPDLKKELQGINKRRRGWRCGLDDDALLQRVLNKINSSAKELICPYQAHGKITCLDVTVQDDFDPSGELQKVIETNAAEVSDIESEAGEDTSIEEEKDDCVVDENPPNEGKEIDDATRSNPENPCYFPTQIEMAAILKQRIEAIMDYYHEIANLSDVFDDIDFTVYTARYRMLSDQTEQRLCHPDAGVLSKEEVMLHKERKGKKRMFMYGHGEDADKHFEQLKKEVLEKPKTLFIIIADECHWGITKDKDQKPSAHNLFINNWCENITEKKKSPRNVVVVQISATPFNLLTQDSRLPEVRCLVLHDKVTTTRKTYEAGDLLVEETEPEIEERVKETAKEVELHVVDWSEVEVKNFERGMRMKLKSTLSEKGVRSLCRQVSPDAKLDESPEEGDYLSAYLQVLPDGNLHITPGDEADATVFEVQGSHGIVTIKAVVNEEQVLTLTKDESGSLKAIDNPSMPTQFRVKLEYGVGVVAFVCSDGLDLYLTVNELDQVQLQPAKVESKGGVVITKPINDLGEVSFEFYMVHCGPKEVDMVGRQYVSLNYYLSTMNSKDQKIRQDEYFQKIVKNAKKEGLSKIDFTVDAMLCAEYSYYVLHMSTYDSDDKVRQALTAGMDKSPSAQFCETLKSFVRILTKNTSCIHHEVFEWVQIKLCEKVKDDFKTDCEALQKFKSLNDDGPESKKCKEELVDSFVACLMHLSPQELGELREKYADVKLIEEELKENNCEKLVKIWNTIVQESETNCLVQSLIQSGEQGSGKMKIVRAKSRKTADQFFFTLFEARRLASKDECFEIISDYGKFNLKRHMTLSNTFFQKLQPRKCQFQFECHCSDLKLHPGRPKCGNCQHVHKPITQYEDLQNLACVLILVDKGRMGDTFPESFDCLDLRLNYDEGSPIVLSTVIQELGRMCRYAKLSADGSFVQNVPYALVGAQLFKRLKMSLDFSPAVRAISCTTVDRYMKNSKSKRKHSTSLRWSKFQADKESYDYQNNDRPEKIEHCNRILLQAEPQIGKTGTYLCLIKQLRKDILFKENDEGNFYLVKESSASEGHHVMNGNNEAEDWNFPYWKTIQESPSLLQKSVGPGKYSIGGRFYTHDTTNFPFILTKSEGLSQLTKTVYHRQVDNIPTGAVRAWHWHHFLNCAECGRFLEGKGPELQSIKVNIDGKPVTVKCSVPASRRPYKCLLEKLPNSTSQGEVWTEDSLASAIKSVHSSLFWIFHPSHRDDPCKCLLNYHHALQNENKEITFFQVAVVRSEKFQDYVKTWGKMLVIFQLPDQLPMEGEDEDVGPSEGGIGYARRFIQEMAFALKLEYVFVIDDNVAVMSEALVSPGESATCNDTVIRNDDGVIRMEPCSFWRPLNYLQKIVRGKDKPPDVRKYEEHPLTEEFDRQNLPLYRYTGPAKLFEDKPHESYGVLGFLRSVPNTVRPFAKTQVYAAILLNVKSTVEKRVWYRPWPCWEDLRFNDDCDKEGLWVVKCNRFHFHKVQYNDWINSLVLPGIFQWTEDTKVEKRLPESMLPIELEEGIILKHLLRLVNEDGHGKCFEGKIGYSDSQDCDSDVSPMELLEKLRINEPVDSALAKPIPILILAYSLLELEIEDLSKLEELYCRAEQKIVFIVSAKEAQDEWKNNMTLDCLDSGILKTKTMKKRKAKFSVFSAADPSRHLLRWIVIEVSFKGEDISISDATNTPQDINDAGVHELPSSDQLESSVCEKSVSKRSVEVIVDRAKEISQQTRPSGKEDVEEMVVDPNTFANQLEPEQHTVVSFLPSEPGCSKRVTNNTTPVTSKKRKSEDGTCNSTSTKTVRPKMKVTLGKSAETEEKEVPSAVQPGQSSNRDAARGTEARIVQSEPQEEVVASTLTLSHSVKRKAPKGALQLDVENDVPPASKRAKSQITRLTPEDPAYIGGASEVTRAIVELWREKMNQKDNKDIDREKVKAKMENFETEDLERLDGEGFSALTKACSLPSMSPRIVSYLLNKKMVDVNSQLPDWFTTGDREAANLIPLMSALSMALLRGNVKCVSTFMQRKNVIKFESKDQKGNTALHYCVSTREAFEKLWPNYEKMNWRDMTNDEGKNPCDDAKEKYEKSSPTIETKKKKVTPNKTREALEFAINKMDPEWLKNRYVLFS